MISEMLGVSQPRGLYNFISDIRNATSKEDERARVDKELANIRAKFNTSAQLNAYQRKKYVWKMCYIHTLGYDVDFGQMEFVSLMASSKYQEKAVGYMAASLLLRPGDEMMNLAINSIRNDLRSNINFAKCLALSAISNIGGKELAEALSSDVQEAVVPPGEAIPSYNIGPQVENESRNKSFVCKKACLCLLRLFRINADCVDMDRDWVGKMARIIEDRDIGVVLSAVNLLTGLATVNPTTFEPLIPYIISVLTRLVIDRSCPPDYLYYRTPSPWLQCKCLRFLQLYRLPEKTQAKLLNDILQRIIEGTEPSDNANKSNADYSVLFEALNLIISYGNEGNEALRTQAQTLLGRFISVRDPNIRYLGLDALTRLAHIDGPASVQAHQQPVLESLRDVDISVRKRALDLMFAMTDATNATEIVDELITTLPLSDAAVKEEIVVKVAILAEKFAPNWQWYIDSMSRVILVAGDHVAEAVWFRIVQIVLNNKDIHDYAAEKMLTTAQNKYAHEISVALSAYLLGEIGVNICTKTGMSGYDQFAALHQHFARVSTRVQAILLTTYVKFVNLYPDTRDIITEVFHKYSTSNHLELQQRACEYLVLPTMGGQLLEKVLEDMPAYAGDQTSSLYAMIKNDKQPVEKAPVGSSSESSSSSNSNNNNNNSGNNNNINLSNNNKAQVVDLLSINDAPISSAGVGIPSDVIPRLKQWFSASVVAAAQQKTILYEDELLRISYAAEFRVHQGRIALTFYNKTGADLVNFKVSFAEAPHVTLRVQDPASRIACSDEARAQIAVECLRPFANPLSMDVNFSVGQAPYKYTMNFPVVGNSFFEALNTDKETFMTRWKAVVGEGLEVQEVFQAAKPIDAAYLTFVRNTVMPGLRLGAVTGIDTETTITASGSFRTGTTGADGNLIAIGALLRIEADVNGGRFRVTVRAKHPLVAQSVKNTLKLIIGSA